MGVVFVLTEGITSMAVVLVVAAARVSSRKPPPLTPSLVSWVGGSLTLPPLHTKTATSGPPPWEARLGRTGQGAQDGQPQRRRRPRSRGTETEPVVMSLAAMSMTAATMVMPVTLVADVTMLGLDAGRAGVTGTMSVRVAAVTVLMPGFGVAAAGLMTGCVMTGSLMLTTVVAMTVVFVMETIVSMMGLTPIPRPIMTSSSSSRGR